MVLAGLTASVINHKNSLGNKLDSLPCVEYVIVDGFPYCGVYMVNGVKHEVTFGSIEGGNEIATFNTSAID